MNSDSAWFADTENLLDEPVVIELQSIAEKSQDWTSSTIYNRFTGKTETDASKRLSRQCSVSTTTLPLPFIDFFLKRGFTVSSRWTFVRYEPNHYFKRHKDRSIPADRAFDTVDSNDKTVFKVVVYLSTAESERDGGETLLFNDENKNFVAIAPRAGLTLFFKPSETPHAAATTRIPKLILTGYVQTRLNRC